MNACLLILVQDHKDDQEELSATQTLPKPELVRRLRERGAPILLFGETLIEACERLKQIELDAPDASWNQASGLTNDFKEARETVDQEYLQQMLNSQGIKDELDKGGSKLDVNLYESQCTYEELLEMANDLGKGDMEHDHKVVQEFILVLMKEWGQELNDRDKDTKMSVKGKTEATTYAQTRLVHADRNSI